LTFLDKKIVQEMKEDIEDSIFADEYGYAIDSLGDLDPDKDIIDRALGGGNEDE